MFQQIYKSQTKKQPGTGTLKSSGRKVKVGINLSFIKIKDEKGYYWKQ